MSGGPYQKPSMTPNTMREQLGNFNKSMAGSAPGPRGGYSRSSKQALRGGPDTDHQAPPGGNIKAKYKSRIHRPGGGSTAGASGDAPEMQGDGGLLDQSGK